MTEIATLSTQNAAKTTRIAPSVRRPRLSNGLNSRRPPSTSGHVHTRSHPAEVVAAHVADEHVVAGLQGHVEVPRPAGLAGLERADRDLLERVLVGGHAVGAHRERPGGADEDQLVLVRALVVDDEVDVAGGD